MVIPSDPNVPDTERSDGSSLRSLSIFKLGFQHQRKKMETLNDNHYRRKPFATPKALRENSQSSHVPRTAIKRDCLRIGILSNVDFKKRTPSPIGNIKRTEESAFS